MCKKIFFLVLVSAFCLMSSAQSAQIIWVTQNRDYDGDNAQDDQEWVDILGALGHTVDLRPDYWNELNAGKIAELEAADLIIMGRGSGSGSFDDGEEPTQWNSITTPLILMTPYPARSNRWLWMDTTSVTGSGGTPMLEVAEPDHDVFFGITIDETNQLQVLDGSISNGQTSFMQNIDIGNGTLIAKVAEEDWAFIVKWEQGIEFYDGSGQFAGGPRMLFAGGASGSTGEGQPRGVNNFTDIGFQIFLNAIRHMIGEGFPIATGPNPPDRVTDLPREVVLSWKPGAFADTHNVYLGTSFTDIDNAEVGSPLLVGQNHASLTYNAGRLDLGQTYYWRIDEVNAPPDLGVHRGKIWSFTIEPVGYPILAENIIATASSNAEAQGPENTINGSGLVDDTHSKTIQEMWLTASGEQDPAWIQYEFDKPYKLYEMLVWNYNGHSVLTLYGVKDVIVEHSTDGVNWTQLDSVSEFTQATGSDDYTYNTIVAFEGTVVKHVRISPQSTWGGDFFAQYGLSEVRFLYLPVDAREPDPADGTTDLGVDTTLSWRAGREAAEHNVYISADQQAVTDGTAYVDTLTQTSYSPSGLELGSVYYWRIEEVNNAETPTTWPGDIWSFSTQEYIVVEDFESYNDIPEGQQGSRLVYIIWEDGYANPTTNGSTMGYPAGASMEADIVKGGMQSVPIIYDNSVAGSSEVTINTNDLPIGRNWSIGSPQTLVLWIRGDLGNAASDQLYVKVNNAKVMYGSDLSIPLWKQWNVDLASLGISLSNIASLSVGVEGSGSGMFYLDEIALYRVAPPIVESIDPGTGGLVAHYAMENNVQDSSGNNLHGTANGDPTYVQGLPGYGMALSLDGSGDYVDLPIGSTISALTDCTVATWVNWSGAGGAWQRIFDIGTGASVSMFLTPSAGSVMRFAITTSGGGGESQANASGTLSTGWHHVAVVIDSTSMSLALYLDGEVVAGGPTQTLPSDLGNTNQNWLGRSQYTADEYFNGSLDDFRIYNTALSESEVRYVVGDK